MIMLKRIAIMCQDCVFCIFDSFIFSDPPTVSVSHSPDSAKKMTLTCKVVILIFTKVVNHRDSDVYNDGR